MAGSVTSLFRLNVGLANNVLLRNNFLNGIRCIYTERSLGINGYEAARLRTRNQFLNVEAAFREKMKDVCKEESNMIFTEDLKAMSHLVQKKDEDTQLLIKMMEKFNKQNQELRFGTFIFGPVVMRTFYYLDEPKLALSTFQNPELENFFDQSASYQVLMSLLYKHKMYSDIRNVYDVIKKKHTSGRIYANNCLILVTAACYKENTPESLEYVLNLWKDLNEKGFALTRKAITFIVALAFNQDAVPTGIEIMSAIREARYIATRCLRVLGFAKMNKFTEIIPIFRGSLDYDVPHTRKQSYFHDVIEVLENKLKEAQVEENAEIYKLLTQLKQNDFVTYTQTLDEHLSAPIDVDPRPRDRKLMTLRGESQKPRFKQYIQKPELRDLL